MRTIASSIMATLVITALFWGNCFSCPQLLLGLRAHQPSHGCCHKTKQASSNCDTRALQHFVKSDPGSHAPAVAVVAATAESAPTILGSTVDLSPAPADHAPPVSLFSLRI